MLKIYIINKIVFESQLFIADVITIEKTGEFFRLIYDVKGRFAIHRITAEEAKVSIFLNTLLHYGPFEAVTLFSIIDHSQSEANINLFFWSLLILNNNMTVLPK